ncbi:MAG TPA: hypothetical protein VN420_05440 [Candidatus Fimivivens sp.]|nr:hypothetical protein [Candidatus Fimivivens sp.]
MQKTNVYKFIAIILLVIGSFFSKVATAKESAPRTEPVSNVFTIDVGPNIKQLGENGGSALQEGIAKTTQLAEKKAREAYPTYRAQAVIEGRAGLCACIGLGIISLLSGIGFIALGIWLEEPGFHVGTVIAFAIFAIDAIVGVFMIPTWIAMSTNPDYWAIHKMMDDINKLITPILSR